MRTLEGLENVLYLINCLVIIVSFYFNSLFKVVVRY